MAQVSVSGGTAAATSSGILTIILGAELKRRNIAIDQEELLAVAALLAPTLHVSARVVTAIVRAAVKKWVGIDIEAPDAPPAAAP